MTATDALLGTGEPVAADGGAAAGAELPSPRWSRRRVLLLGQDSTAGAVSLALALLVLLILLSWMVAPTMFTSYDPIVGIPGEQFLAPGAAHWFGTDEAGRDTFARVVYGTPSTLLGAVIAVAIGLVIGSLVGVVAATARGLVEAVLMRFVDVLLALPGFVLALCIVSGIGPGTTHIAFGVGIAAIAPFARITRGEALRVSQLEYVEAGRLAGTSHLGVLLRHVLPNSAGPVLALVPVEFGATILNLAALGFLGYGAPPPAPEWGTLLAEGRNYLEHAWWMTTLPGLVVVITVLSFARIGYWVQARFRI